MNGKHFIETIPSEFELDSRSLDPVTQSDVRGTARDRMALAPSNLIETIGSYFLQIALPGIDTASLEISIAGRLVIVRATFHAPVIELGTDLWRELPAGSFEETFRLPSEIDGDHGEAHYTHGILSIRVPKISSVPAKRLHVDLLS